MPALTSTTTQSELPKRRVSERIGVMGGAFDPIHLGHLVLAMQAYEQLSLTRLLFVPTFQSAHQNKEIETAFEHRCAMVEAAIENCDQFSLSKIETAVSGKSYSVKTLQLLRQQYPKAEFFFLMGADSLEQLETWYLPEELLAMATVVVAGRPGYGKPDHPVPERIRFLAMPLLEISASDIRRRVREGRSIRFLVPDRVEAYILHHGLYRE